LQTGGAFFAPASATCLMVEAILLNQSRLLPAAAYFQGEYGLENICIGVPCRLGCGGIDTVLELNLTDVEMAALHTSAEYVRESIERSQQILATSDFSQQ
jgi:malate dehydrogenase